MENNQVSSGVSTMPMKKKKGKSRAGIYVALVIAFLGLFGIAAAAGVMFFAFNASLSSIESSVDSQNSKIDQLSDDLMDAKNDVDMLETNMKDDSHMIPGESTSSSTSSSSSATTVQKTFSDTAVPFSFKYSSDLRLFKFGESYIPQGGTDPVIGPSSRYFIFATNDGLKEWDNITKNKIGTDATPGEIYIEYVKNTSAQKALDDYVVDFGEITNKSQKTIGSYNVLTADYVAPLTNSKLYFIDSYEGVVIISDEIGDSSYVMEMIKTLE